MQLSRCIRRASRTSRPSISMKPCSAIVNTGSVTGLLGSESLLDYSMTKGGIHAFTRSLATHLVPEGIRVNAVAYVFLALAQCSSYITGEVLPIIGGYSGG